MRAYYGSRFSPNMTATPEGFLICHNVPIARTGWYDYLGEEVGAPELSGKVVKVYRSPEEVFSPVAIASFEGKPTVDEHPPENVTPDNATRYTKGMTKNVRQGSGDESDLILADLVIYDEYVIQEIMDGKREVSCGYDCTYVPQGDGTYTQTEICGNHVAVVRSGRAGDRVAIRDHKPKGDTRMAKIILPRKGKSRITDILAAVGLKHFAMDAEPEEIREAVDAMAEERVADDDDKLEGKEQQAKDDSGDVIKTLTEQVKALSEQVAKLSAKEGAEDSAEKVLDDAIAELESEKKPAADDDNEESHTIEAGALDDKGPVAPEAERPQQVIDNAYKISALRAIKPIIAAISDPAEKRRVADAAIASFKSVPKTNTYAKIQNGQKQAAKDSQEKAKQQPQQQDLAELGRKWAVQFNPHYKNKN